MIPKEHREFYELDMSNGWQTPEGYPEGIKQKILSGSLDQKNKTGSRTRVLTIAPGTYTIDPFVH